MSLPFLHQAFLFGSGLFAGTVDAICGGGGLIALPALLLAHVNPALALGTNKFQAMVGTSIATWRYHKSRLLKIESVIKGLGFGFIGASLGTLTAIHIHSQYLNQILPWLLLAILIYFIYMPHLGLEDNTEKISARLFYPVFGFCFGFYDGFFGPAVGTFWIFAFVFLLGFNLAKASAFAKVFNLKSNIIAFVWFACFHQVDYQTGIIMALGQALGGYLGSKWVIHHGAALVKPIYIIVVTIMISSLFYKAYC